MEKTTSMKEMVMNMMCHERENLQEDLHAAKLSYADINLEEGDYKCRDERKTNCKVIEGQIVMLNKVMKNIMEMNTEVMMPTMV